MVAGAGVRKVYTCSGTVTQCRATASSLAELLHSAFGFSSFRANQEAVCRAAIEGKDVLLVMPTGSGKSLCYQLPGIARGGTTLVISPLIALMEDQVGKLKERGFEVERIHSGRDSRLLAPGLRGLPERQAAISFHRAGTVAAGRFPGNACEAQTVSDRHRRGALHFAMGA